MELIRGMEDYSAAAESNLLSVKAYLDRTLINVHHFPEIVRLSVKNKIFIKFKIMHGYDL